MPLENGSCGQLSVELDFDFERWLAHRGRKWSLCWAEEIWAKKAALVRAKTDRFQIDFRRENPMNLWALLIFFAVAHSKRHHVYYCTTWYWGNRLSDFRFSIFPLSFSSVTSLCWQQAFLIKECPHNDGILRLMDLCLMVKSCFAINKPFSKRLLVPFSRKKALTERRTLMGQKTHLPQLLYWIEVAPFGGQEGFLAFIR